MEPTQNLDWNESWAKRLILPITLVWFALAVFFVFYDLKISIQFVNAKSSWALFVSKFGEFPGLVIVIIAMFIINTYRKNKRSAKSILLSVVLLFLIALTSYYMIVLIVYHLSGSGEFFVKFGTHLWIVFGSVAIMIQVILYRTSPKISDRLDKFARITFWSALLNYVLFVQIGKALWGRVRLGGHYASDVLFPTGVAILVYIFLYKHYHFRIGAEQKG